MRWSGAVWTGIIVAISVGCGRDAPGPKAIRLSNVALPLDANGNPLLTGEASVLSWGGAHYFYFDDWGTCPGVDCCGSKEGCASCCFNPPTATFPDACVYADGHSVVVYRTTDFLRWEYLGVALAPSDRRAGILFRPRVIYHARSSTFVMWYEDRWLGQNGYAIAKSSRPEGPFTTIADSVALHGSGRVGDFDLFVDDDGAAYHVRTGFTIERLTPEYIAGSGAFTTVEQRVAEAPIMFRRRDTYYLLAGSDCCACRGGSNVLVYTSTSPLGRYTLRGDVGTVRDARQTPDNPDRYVTRAQGTAVFRVSLADRSEAYVWLGNQWVTAAGEGHPRDQDLLYWSVLEFDASGSIGPFVRRDAAMLLLPQ